MIQEGYIHVIDPAPEWTDNDPNWIQVETLPSDIQAKVDAQELAKKIEEKRNELNGYLHKYLVDIDINVYDRQLLSIEKQALDYKYKLCTLALGGHTPSQNNLNHEATELGIPFDELAEGFKVLYNKREVKARKLATYVEGIRNTLAVDENTDIPVELATNTLATKVRNQLKQRLFLWSGSQTSSGNLNIPDLKTLVDGRALKYITVYVKYAVTSDPTLKFKTTLTLDDLVNGTTVTTEHQDGDTFRFNGTELEYITSETDNELYLIDFI